MIPILAGLRMLHKPLRTPIRFLVHDRQDLKCELLVNGGDESTLDMSMPGVDETGPRVGTRPAGVRVQGFPVASGPH